MMSKGFTGRVRPVELGDLEALVRFFKKNNQPEVVRQFHPFPLSQEEARRIVSHQGRDRFYVMPAKSHDIVGLCMLRGWAEGYRIPSFGLLVDYRHYRFGIGRAMTEFAIAEAKRLGCESLRLSVNASNSPARSLYESLGFREVSKSTIVFAGEADAKVVMMKDLTADIATL
jgi:ribosomal-protein-alanine N-acetyltransferase